jgi:DNA polymerase III epsilon subunit-like protein
MIVTGIDLESTGLNKTTDRTIEVGLVLWSTNFRRGLETSSFLVDSEGVAVTPEITRITGVHPAMVTSFGWSVDSAWEEIRRFVSRSEAVVAFNGRRFDIPMLKNWGKRMGEEFPDMLVIDPYEDMPENMDSASPGMRPQELITMCAKNGIYYDAHEALADVNGMLKLMSKRPLEFVLERAKSETIIVRAVTSRYDNTAVKQNKFRWYNDNAGTKFWWKKLKRIDLPILIQEVDNEFGLEEIDFPIELLEPEEKR